MERGDREWRGSRLDMLVSDMDPNGIREVIIELEGGETETFRPRRREVFHAYELHEMASYLHAVQASIKKSQRD